MLSAVLDGINCTTEYACNLNTLEILTENNRENLSEIQNLFNRNINLFFKKSLEESNKAKGTLVPERGWKY